VCVCVCVCVNRFVCVFILVSVEFWMSLSAQCERRARDAKTRMKTCAGLGYLRYHNSLNMRGCMNNSIATKGAPR
jgi:hypothetical protein